MSPHRILILVAILLSCQGGRPTEPAPGSASPAPVPPTVAAPKVPSLPPPRPTLQGSNGKPTAESVFDAQVRDDDWASTAETEIRQRFTHLRGGTLQAAECRQSQCKLVIAGSEGEVGKTIADLESNRGLHGYAKNILLTAPETKPDGSIVLHAFAMFDR